VKNILTSYFILLLYIVFSVGVVIEDHRHCSVCDNGECEIEGLNNHESCCNHNSYKLENNNKENHCNCKIEQFKIKSDYTSEEKLKINSSSIFLISFIYTIYNEKIEKTQTNSSIIYSKSPDLRLFHKLSVNQLSSILC
jgi:hypothetical protein